MHVAALKSSCKQSSFSKQFEISNWSEFTSGLIKRALSQTSQICSSGLNRPINENEKKTKERQKAEEEEEEEETQFSGVR